MSLERKAVSGVRWNGLASLIASVLGIAQLTVLAHYLSAEEFGLMGMVMIAVVFAQTFSALGVSAGVIHRQNATQEQLSSLYWLSLMLAVPVCGIYWFAIPSICWVFEEPALDPLLRVMTVIFLVVPLGKQFEVLLQSDLAFRSLAIQETLGAVSGFAVATYGAMHGWGCSPSCGRS